MSESPKRRRRRRPTPGPRRSRRRHRERSGRRRSSWVAGLACLLAVLAWQMFGDRVRLHLGLPTDAMPPKGAALRVVTYNLENFPNPHQDLPALRRTLLDLDADVIGVQEVKDPAQLRDLMPEFDLVVSEGGGRGQQRVGVLFDPATVTVTDVREHHDISLRGRVRPALTAYVAHRDGGPDFHLAVVHLKAMPEGYAQRREQVPLLSKLLEGLNEEGSGPSDSDVVLLGDFNVVGGPSGHPTAAAELADLDGSLAAVKLRQVPVPTGCSAYWDGPRRDAWKEPSLLDLVWIGDFREADPDGLRARGGTHCGQHACAPFRSTDAYPEASFERVSDHCPVVVDLPLRDDDP